MELMKNMSAISSSGEENTKLLFFENYKNEKSQYNVEEIFFGKAVLLQQIRILKSESNPHPKIKSMQSISQSAPIYNFEIFARNLKKYSDKFECIFESSTVNEGTNDVIFPLLTDFVTNHIVIRGMFERITLCVYGVPYTGSEGHLLLETAKNDVPLEKLITSEELMENLEERINLTNDDVDLLNNYTIESLISPYIKCEVMGGLKRAYYINPPNVNMVEKTKTGYIYYENDLNYFCQSLYVIYSNNTITVDEVTFQTGFKKIYEIIKILISKNYTYIEDDCIFRQENNEIFHKIPLYLVDVVVYALEGRYLGYSEIKLGLKILKIISNSSHLVTRFIDKCGLEVLYSLILAKDAESLPDLSDSVIKVLVLENIYRLLTHAKVFSKFMETVDRSKLQQHQHYFMISEYTKDFGEQSEPMQSVKESTASSKYTEGKSKKKSKTADRADRSERERKKSRKEKKSRKDKRSKSRSEVMESHSSSEREKKSNLTNSSSKDKKQAKNVLLKNGYQIVLTLLLGKRNNLIVNMVKKVLNKVSFLLYLKELDNLVNNQRTTYSDKIASLLQKVFDYLQKVEVAYKKSFDKDQPCGFSDDYPYRNFWVDYLKIGRRFFKKSENFNLKSTLENESNSINRITDTKIITNEIAIMLEENNFISNLILLMSDEKFSHHKQYTEHILIIKGILSLLLLSKGGINFFSKNFEVTMILRNFLIKATDSLINTSTNKEENFRALKVRGSQKEVYVNKSLAIYEDPIESNINTVLVNVNSEVELADDYIVKINLLQLRYFLELQFVFLTKFDDYMMFKLEDSKSEDFIDKSLDILLIFSQNLNRSYLSKQAFISLFQNEFFIEEIFSMLRGYLNDSIEFEAHITLLLEILSAVFTENNKSSDVILLLYGAELHDLLSKLRVKMQVSYDDLEMDPVNKDFYNKCDALCTLLQPVKMFSESREIKPVMSYVNESLFNNIQKYNLNEKPVNEDNLKDENIKDYVKGLKLNVLNYSNSDVDYLETLRKKNSLINDLFSAVKIINLSIRINPLLLIDCVNEHIHLALRYLIVNTVHSLKHLLCDKRNYCPEKYIKIKEYSIFLHHIYDILQILLKHLLSSHVDNYRDNIVIDQTVELLICVINYLFESHSCSSGESNSSVNEYVQKLFESVLEAFKQICKFNTTIKLNFEKILEKTVERPSNKVAMIYILNFMFNTVSNQYTIETFVEVFTKVQKVPVIDVYQELESGLGHFKKNQVVKIGNLCDEKSFLRYVIDSGMNTNSEWIVFNCANLLLSILRVYLKGKINEEVMEYTMNILDSAYVKISKVRADIMEDKEIESYLPHVDFIYRIVKFLFIFLKSEYKFIFLFHDITFVYLKILNYCNDYLKYGQSNSHSQSPHFVQFEYRILDLNNLLLDSFVILCDSNKGFRDFVHEDWNKSDYSSVVEELPNKTQILAIINDTRTFLDPENLKEVILKKDQMIVNKYLVISSKAAKILTKLSQNFYGQTLILYSDYSSGANLPVVGKPSVFLNDVFNFIVENLPSQNSLNTENVVLICDNLITTLALMLYDLNYEFGNLNANVNDYSPQVLSAQDSEQLVLTETRLFTFMLFFLGSKNFIKNDSKRNAKFIVEILTNLNLKIQNLIENSVESKLISIFNLKTNIQRLISLFDNEMKLIKIIHTINTSTETNLKTVRLPNARKIIDKCELIRRYYDYVSTQNYGFTLPISNNTSNANLFSGKISEFSKQHINEFEKLLNWKKHRIYLSKMDYLITRTNIFDLDTSLRTQPEVFILKSGIKVELLSSTLIYKKHISYVNSEPFQQFCNQNINENLVLNKFANISYAVTSSTVHNVIFTSEEYHNSSIMKLLYKNILYSKYDLEYVNVNRMAMGEVKAGFTTSAIGIKKKANSKLNTFVYKPKYDKLPKQMFVQPQMLTSMSIRDNNRLNSMVSGRPLSMHVDKVNPSQGVVNLTYSTAVVIEEIVDDSVAASVAIKTEELVETKDNVEIVSNTIEGSKVAVLNVASNVVSNVKSNVISAVSQQQQMNAMQGSVNVTNKVPQVTGGIVNPQLNLRMMAPHNFMSNPGGASNNMNLGFMGGYNQPMTMNMNMQPNQQIGMTPNNPYINYGNTIGNMPNMNTMGNMPNMNNMNTMGNMPNMNTMGNMNNIPNMSNMPNMNNMGNMPFNYGGVRPNMGSQPMMNTNQYQNYPMNKMGNMGSITSNISNMSQNMGNMNQFNNYPQMTGMNQMMPSPVNLDLRMNPNSSGITNANNTLVPQVDDRKIFTTTNLPIQTNQPSLTPQNPSNMNLLTNIVQAFNQLHKLGQVNSNQGANQTDKSKDPRVRKKKE